MLMENYPGTVPKSPSMCLKPGSVLATSSNTFPLCLGTLLDWTPCNMCFKEEN